MIHLFEHLPMPPGTVMILAALVMALLPLKKGKKIRMLIALPFSLLAAVMALLIAVDIPAEYTGIYSISIFSLHMIEPQPFTLIFALVFGVMAIASLLYAWTHQMQQHTGARSELCASLIYAGSAINLLYAGDFLTLFFYVELMALAGAWIIVSAGTARAQGAALRYLLVHLLSGALLLMGILLWISTSGSTELVLLDVDMRAVLTLFSAEADRETWAAFLMLMGIAINAGVPPFSAWIADAYPEASPSGTVMLSAYTTKASVFLLLTLFPGSDLLIALGMVMIFYGILYALLENNIRRLLCYSIVSQVGFMLVGIGIGSSLAIAAVALMAFSHILYKALLLMSAGAIITQTGTQHFTSLGGLYRSMPLTLTLAVIASLSWLALPLTAGFTAKSLYTSSLMAALSPMTWLFIKAALSVSVVVALVYIWFIFFHRDSGLRPKEPPQSMHMAMQLAMLLLAVCCVIPGVFPTMFLTLLPYAVDYTPFDTHKILTQMQIFLGGGLVFFLLLPMLARMDMRTIDMDWLYRNGLMQCVAWLRAPLGRLIRNSADEWKNTGRQGVWLFSHICSRNGIFAKNWKLGVSLTSALLLFILLLVLTLS